MTADVWAPLRYGWDHTYWLTVDGIPHVWTEVSHGKTLPTGFDSEEAALVIDESAKVGAQIDRDEGIGAGFPLSFTLLDCSALSALFTRPSVQTYLTAPLTASGGTATVEDNSAFAASGSLYINQERIDYTGKPTGTTFTLSNRGVAGIAFPHRADGGGSLVTDTPRYWRGRFVTLYALPTDPTGYATGSTWLADSAVIWRGFIDAEPERGEFGWSFNALPMDRMLARELVGSLTGELTDTQPKFQVDSDDIMVWGQRVDAGVGTTDFKIVLTPFATAGYTKGNWIGVSEANAAIKSAWSAALSANGITWLGDMVIYQASPAQAKASYFTEISAGDWVPLITVKQSANTDMLTVNVYWFGEQPPSESRSWGSAGVPSDQTMTLGVNYSWTPYQILSKATKPNFALPRGTVRFTEGDPGTIPDSGLLKIGDNVWKYNDVLQTTEAAVVQFAGLSPVGHTVELSASVGATVEVVFADSGNLAAVILRALHSSGESGLRDATYDTLPGIVGYGLPTAYVNQSTLTTLLTEGWLEKLTFGLSLAGQSLVDVVSGALALSGRALVMTDDAAGGDAAFSAVWTSAAGAVGGQDFGDEHVIVRNGGGVRLSRIRSPNTITVEMQQGGKTVYTLREIDRARVASEGAQDVKWTLPSSDKDGVIPAFAGWAAARIVGDTQIALLEVDVVPWLAVRPGDMVNVTLTHPAVWSWASGALGYTGRARCIGREVKLQDGVQTLTMLLDGIFTGTALCPAAPVTAYAGAAASPTSIDVPRAYYHIMAGALAAASPFRLLHYEPGDSEPTGEYYLISAVTDTGSVCRLTVDTVGGSSVLSSSSYLTWPESADCSTYQATWMHDGDGSRWL